MQHHYYLSFCSMRSLVPVSWWGLTFPSMWDDLVARLPLNWWWPIHVAAKAVGPSPSGGNVVLGLCPAVGGAVVVGANWMEPVRTAVGAHVPDFLHLGLPALASAAATSIGAAVGILGLIVGHLQGHGGNGGSELLDLGLYCCRFFLCLHIDGVVGCVGCTRTC